MHPSSCDPLAPITVSIDPVLCHGESRAPQHNRHKYVPWEVVRPSNLSQQKMVPNRWWVVCPSRHISHHTNPTRGPPAHSSNEARLGTLSLSLKKTQTNKNHKPGEAHKEECLVRKGLLTRALQRVPEVVHRLRITLYVAVGHFTRGSVKATLVEERVCVQTIGVRQGTGLPLHADGPGNSTCEEEERANAVADHSDEAGDAVEEDRYEADGASEQAVC